jgi:hypothetical protein
VPQPRLQFVVGKRLDGGCTCTSRGFAGRKKVKSEEQFFYHQLKSQVGHTVRAQLARCRSGTLWAGKRYVPFAGVCLGHCVCTVQVPGTNAAVSRISSFQQPGSPEEAVTRALQLRQRKMEGLFFNVNNGYVVPLYGQ